jgi:hypothetical protein
VCSSSTGHLRAELISALANKQLQVGSNLNLCAVCENKGGGMTKRRVTVRVHAEIPRRNGDEGTIRWEYALKTHT